MIHQSMKIQQALEKLQPHDHLCAIYETQDEWRNTIVPFFAIGLEHGDKCAYIVDNHTADEIRKYLREYGINVESVESSGQLVILHETEAYTKSGQFDPDKMIELLIEMAEMTLKEGYSCLRVTGETSWVLRGHPGSEKLLEYESRLNRDFFQKYPCVGLCQYDRRRLDPEVIEGVILTHPLLARGEYIYDNFYYMPTDEYLSENRHEHQIQGWLNNLEQERSHLEQIHYLAEANLAKVNESLRKEIAERKQVADALRESEKRFRTAIENMLDSFSICTAIRDEAGQIKDFLIEYVNEAACKSNFMTREEQVGKRLLDLFPNFGDSERFAAYCKVVETGEPLVMEAFERDKYLNAHQINDARIVKLGDGYAITWRNITEQKRMEEALRNSENQLRRLDRLHLVGEMAAGIGHEIRNPMTAVRGYLQLLQGKIEFLTYKKYFDTMISELDRANTIITEYLTLAKNKAVNLIKQSLNSILETMLPLIQAEAIKNNQSVTLELSDVPDLLLDDKEIRQIVLNLARNGLEAMPAKGALTIRTYLDGTEVVLAVQNHGPEIPPEILEKIGTPFFTTKENGTGLGMAVCYSIAARHNASIRIETGAARTTFSVCFKN